MARGGPLDVRQALGAELEDVWKLESAVWEGEWVRDQAGSEAEAMEAEASTGAGMQLTFALNVEGTVVGHIRAMLLDDEMGMLIGAQCHPALSLSSVGKPLVRAARHELVLRGAKTVVGVAPLPGLCKWIVAESAWERLDHLPGFTEDQPAAVEAVAKGAPQPGDGTFEAAAPAFRHLAMQYGASLMGDVDSEVAMFGMHADAKIVAINWMYVTDEAALLDCAGCTATMSFLRW